MNRLAVFDLDKTLLAGDSEVLWVGYLLARGLLDATLAARNDEMDRRYHAGQATPAEFCAFYASIFGGKTPAEWAPLLSDFVATVVRPRIGHAAHALVRQHREAGDLLVLSTASSRFLSAPSAALLGFDHLIATELETGADGCFTGRTAGTLNMQAGKVTRLREWLAGRAIDADEALAGAVFYSDSINDLPLLLAVGQPITVGPDARLKVEAVQRGWLVLASPSTDSFIPAS